MGRRAQAQLDDRAPTEIEPGENEEGDKLGHCCSKGGSLHAHAQPPVKHEYGVQHHIEQCAGDDGNGGDLYGRLCPRRTVHALGGQIGQGRHKHPEGIVFGQRERCLRGAESPHQRFDKHDAAHTQDRADDNGQADDGGNGTAGSVLIFGPKLPPCQHGGSGGKDVLNGYHDEQKGNGDPHCRQGDVIFQHSDVGGIHNVVNCFGQQGQGGGKGQLDDGL